MIDREAAQMPWVAGLSPCLHVPVAARDLAAIEKHVGTIVREIPDCPNPPGYLVTPRTTPDIDPRLPVWDLLEASILHERMQLWVHVDGRRYRPQFAEAFSDIDILGKDIDHVMNRHVARLKGFHYGRVVCISPAANRSSGAISEKWAIAIMAVRRCSVAIASRRRVFNTQTSPISPKMLNIAVGGGVMDQLNDVQHLFRERRA